MRLFCAIFGFVVYWVSSVAFAMGPVQTFSAPSSDRAEVVSGVDDDGPPPLVEAVATSNDDYRKWIQNVSDVREQQLQTAPGEPSVIVTDPARWTNDFDNVVIVNKAQDVQRATVWRFGQKVKEFPVSTGLEQWVCERDIDKQTHMDNGGWKINWTGTKTGFFTAKRCDIDHRSAEFDDAKMTYACFFNGGIATHQGEQDWLIGHRRASHGCVRMHPGDARQVYDWVMLSGGPVNFDSPELKAQCSPIELGEDPQCQSHRTAWLQSQVRKMLAEGAKETAPDGSSLPRESIPNVRMVDENTGAWTSDPKTFDTKKPGYRTLYIVECIDRAGHDCSKRASQQPVKKTQLDCQHEAEAEALRLGRNPPPGLSGKYAVEAGLPAQPYAQAQPQLGQAIQQGFQNFITGRWLQPH